MKWFVKCIKNYVNYKGRARRSEYWYFILFALIFVCVLRAVDAALFGFQERVIITTVFALLLFLPQTAVMVRRLHDTGRSGKNVLWFYLAGFIWTGLMAFTDRDAVLTASQGDVDALVPGSPAFVLAAGGALVFIAWAFLFLVWFCLEGDKGENKYGPDPKTR